ncbi:MAG: YncE family protein [Prolixibacteraceae bacterium]
MKKLSIFVFGILLVGSAFAGNAPKTAYKIVNKIHLQGDEKWDYLFSDDAAGLLYVSHGNMVQVVDEAKGEMVGKIEGLNGVHGIAIAPALNKGFISTKNDNSVTIFDTKTYKVIQKLEVTGKSPDAILFDKFSQKVFVFNGHSDNVTVLNAETNAIVATIALPGNPEFSATDGKGKIYANIENKSSIVVINATTFKVENVWPLAPGEEPTGLALDNENHRLFSVCANKLMVVVDAETGKVITTLPTGEKTDGAAFDPTLKCAYSSNGAGTITVVKEENKDTFAVLENIPTLKGAKTIAVNKKTHHIYVPTAEFDATPGVEKPKMLPGTFVVLDIVPQL